MYTSVFTDQLLEFLHQSSKLCMSISYQEHGLSKCLEHDILTCEGVQVI